MLLVTTSDERSWAPDQQVLFLGQWCLRYDRRQQWQGLKNHFVAAPFGSSADEKLANVARVQQLAAGLLPELASALNALHGENRSDRYWNIVLGHWLQRYCAVIFNRYHTVDQAVNSYAVERSVWVDPGQTQLAAPTSDAFVWIANDAAWNHEIFARVLQAQGFAGFDYHQTGIVAETPVEPAPAPPSRQETAIRTLQRLSRPFQRPRDAFIINSYLPKLQEVLLQLRLGQFPQLRSQARPDQGSSEARARPPLLAPGGDSGFQRFLRQTLQDVIPRCFVEDYAVLGSAVRQQGWPQDPKFIFTANSFDTDEIFKRWCADKVEGGTPYLTGQHGNNYGAHIYYGNSNWPERRSSDAFLTWGWTDGRNAVPAFLFKTVGRPQARSAAPDKLLLIEQSVPHQTGPEDVWHDFALYQEDQLEFVEAVPAAIRKRTVVRLHGSFRRLSWFEDQRWADRMPDIELELGQQRLPVLVRDSRIVVHSYDSTGLIETLSQNIPTVCFWRGGLSHVLPEAQAPYEALQKVGIVQPSAQAAAAHIAAVWDDVDQWWDHADTQQAIGAFCRRFGVTSNRPLPELAELLTTFSRRPPGRNGHKELESRKGGR